MGVTFRGGGYIKHVWFGKRTIKDGEAAAVWDRFGRHNQIVGPNVVRLFFSTIRFLTRHKAERDQYLVLKYRDGTIEHKRGPCFIYENPAYHDKVRVRDACVLNLHECVIVDGRLLTADMINTNHHGSNMSDDSFTTIDITLDSTVEKVDCSKKMNKGKPETRVLFIPNPSQHIHRFSWSRITEHGLIPADSKYRSHGRSREDDSPTPATSEPSFNVLHMSVPYSFTVNLPVPTSDGFLIHVKLFVEYNISPQTTVEKLLKHQDVPARMYQCLLSDARSRGDDISIDTIRSGTQSDINAVFDKKELYTSLMDIASQCGFEISTVQLTSVELSTDLKTLIQEGNDAMNRVQVELKEKDQRREVCKLDLQLEKDTHDLKLASLERQAALEMFELKAHHEKEKLKDEQLIGFLKQVKDMDVDMTKFLVASVSSNVENKTNERIKQCVQSMNAKMKQH